MHTIFAAIFFSACQAVRFTSTSEMHQNLSLPMPTVTTSVRLSKDDLAWVVNTAAKCYSYHKSEMAECFGDIFQQTYGKRWGWQVMVGSGRLGYRQRIRGDYATLQLDEKTWMWFMREPACKKCKEAKELLPPPLPEKRPPSLRDAKDGVANIPPPLIPGNSRSKDFDMKETPTKQVRQSKPPSPPNAKDSVANLPPPLIPSNSRFMDFDTKETPTKQARLLDFDVTKEPVKQAGQLDSEPRWKRGF